MNVRSVEEKISGARKGLFSDFGEGLALSNPGFLAQRFDEEIKEMVLDFFKEQPGGSWLEPRASVVIFHYNHVRNLLERVEIAVFGEVSLTLFAKKFIRFGAFAKTPIDCLILPAESSAQSGVVDSGDTGGSSTVMSKIDVIVDDDALIKIGVKDPENLTASLVEAVATEYSVTMARLENRAMARIKNFYGC